MEMTIYILKFIIFFLFVTFCGTSLLILMIKLITVALWQKKKLNVKKTFIILYPVLLVSLVVLFFNNLEYKTPPELDLGNSFRYLQEGRDLDYSGYAGDGIFVYQNFKGIPVIFPRVEKYAFDSIYITVKQKYHNKNSTGLMQSILWHNLYDMKWGGIDTEIFPVCDSIMYHDFKRFYEKDRRMSREEHYADSVVFNNQFFIEMRQNEYNYYIVDKQNVLKHGPLSKNEFEIKFKEMNLNSKLWID